MNIQTVDFYIWLVRKCRISNIPQLNWNPHQHWLKMPKLTWQIMVQLRRIMCTGLLACGLVQPALELPRRRQKVWSNLKTSCKVHTSWTLWVKTLIKYRNRSAEVLAQKMTSNSIGNLWRRLAATRPGLTWQSSQTELATIRSTVPLAKIDQGPF